MSRIQNDDEGDASGGVGVDVDVDVDLDIARIMHTVIRDQCRQLIELAADHLGENKESMVRKYLPKPPTMSPLVLHKTIEIPSITINPIVKSRTTAGTNQKRLNTRDKLLKNTAPEERCRARIWNMYQCCKKRINGSDLCGTHMKDLKFG